MPLDISDTRDPIVIINIVISKNESFLGILSGKILPKQIEEIHQLHVYKVNSSTEVEMYKMINLSPEYRQVSKSFDFV